MPMQTCCFCFNLKNGTMAVGFFTLTINLIAIVVLGIFWGFGTGNRSGEPDVAGIIYGVGIGVSALTAIFDIMLIIGVQKNIRALFIPWIVMTSIGIGSSVYMFFGSIVLISQGGFAIGQLIGSLVGIVLACYMQQCVCTYYKSLSPQNIPYENFANEATENQQYSEAQLEKSNDNIA